MIVICDVWDSNDLVEFGVEMYGKVIVMVLVCVLNYWYEYLVDSDLNLLMCW